MKLELLPAELAHGILLSGMHHICFSEPWSPSAMAETLTMPGAAGLIAVDGGSLNPSVEPPGPAGFVLWRIVADEAEILSLAVLPPWRRHGVGGILLDAALDAARKAGAEAMFLEAAVDNRPALTLYNTRHFLRVGLRKGYYADNDAAVMRCELKNKA